ncbi:homologous-pairing protein 2 homolog [Pocillopora damicornis]|uniref:homologous-pairing protein 2 homolog n=1 Tax=Pocillopora damicornis TaxID=46731 RepID=UPI000F556305|nr:homologous-pairing protein 2 homolog [Pocillopora damicornis]
MSKKSEEEASQAVLAYLTKQNRPYSAIDIFSNLHKEYGKTAVQRSLEKLASEGTITEKINGKQKAYAPKQDQFGDYDENEIKKIDSQISACSEKLKKLQETLKTQESELRNVNSTLTTKDAKTKLSELTQKCDKYQERLKNIKSTTKHVTPEEKDKIYKDHKQYVQMWKKRKRLATDILNGILEGYPKPKKQLIEDIGIETDEEYGAVIPGC